MRKKDLASLLELNMESESLLNENMENEIWLGS